MKLPDSLNDFDPAIRAQALAALPSAQAPRQPLHLNMHCHTFYSYNGYDSSPTMIAAHAAADGWYAAGICDFDVLDAMDEFLAAGDQLELRATANLETRVFFKEYAEHEINSPGEPGIYYFMGAGFVRPPAAGSAAANCLAEMRQSADDRTRNMTDRVNDALDPVRLDYDNDVLPLTPAGNATERHLCAAYAAKAREVFSNDSELAAYWASKLSISIEDAASLAAKTMDLCDKIRSKMMKAGGPGYVKPTPATFPALDDVIAMIQACDAIPMATWLDGTTSGESDIRTQLECLIAKGIAAINIIPDRNWNLKDADVRALKTAKFHECVAVANDLGLPVNIGTELNKFGQPWVDDFVAEPMAKVADTFVTGAQIMVGHTRLLRYANISYCGAEAEAEFGADKSARNTFFAKVGALPPPCIKVRDSLTANSAERNYTLIQDAVKAESWD